MLPLLGLGLASGMASGYGQAATNAMTQEMHNKALRTSNTQFYDSQTFNARQAEISRDYGERMSNTQYQRGVKDMKAAGINPMLSFMKGGASSPQASPARSSGGPAPTGGQLRNALGAGVTSAVESSRLNREIKGTNAKVALDKAAAENQNEQAKLNYNSARRVAIELPALEAEARVRKKHAGYNEALAPIDAATDRIKSFLPNFRGSARSSGRSRGPRRVPFHKQTSYHQQRRLP